MPDAPADPDVFATLLAANSRYATAHGHVELSKHPARRLAVVTCMDSRIDVFGALGLSLGEAHVVRNAGARVTPDVLRSLAVSTAAMGIRAILLMGHTDCGLVGVDDAHLRDLVSSATGTMSAEIAALDFLSTHDQERTLTDDCRWLRSSSLIPPGTLVGAALYDVDDGALRWVVEPASVPAPS